MRFAPVLALLFAVTTPASAACFGGIGCTDSTRFRTSALRRLNCDRLWTLRNGILFENGFCFKAGRAAETYGNATCSIDELAKLQLNAIEHSNIRTIAKVEAEKGC